MRLPLLWLEDHVRTDLEPRALAERLAMTGTEVDRIDHHGVAALEHFVVGRVLEAVQHPDADRLRVCSVDVGDGEPRTIVCGAPNVAAGQTVAVARPGAIMPDGTRLKKAKLRGIGSDGMILAEDEVGLGSDHAGIMVLDRLLLDAELAPGAPLADLLPIATEVLELEITPNRPDCLGVFGVAREVHAATGAALGPEPWADDPHPVGDWAGPAIEVRSERCERLTGRLFADVAIGPSPVWLKGRLAAAGQRSINNVVDITNYAMLLTGQPLHAWDADLIQGTLVVRQAEPGERLTTLDDVERTLDDDVVVFADDGGAQSLAGIMGGQRSEVSGSTTRVLMEVATWDGPNVNRTMAAQGLRSEAGARLEKGLAPEQTLQAQAVASRLMVQLTGATAVGGTFDLWPAGPSEPVVVRLRDARVSGLLGAPVERERSAEILTALGFAVAPAPDGLDATVPAVRRGDVTREADLVEEVARLVGYDALPATLPVNRTGAPGRLTPAQRAQRRAEDVLVGRGLTEVLGWSFAEPAVLDRLRLPEDSPMRGVVALENPMSESGSILRPSALPSLLDTAARNVARGQRDLAIFESGTVYQSYPDSPLAAEHHALAGLLHGRLAPVSWAAGPPPTAGFFAAKALVEAVFATLRVELSVRPGDWPFLHPGRQAAVHAGEHRIGFVGEVHPLVARTWELEGTVAAFAIDLGRLVALVPEAVTYVDVTSYPAVLQDLAVVVDEDVPAAAVEAVVAGVADTARVFDVYRGEQLGAGRKSLALRCRFSASDRTLSEDDVARLRGKIVKRLADELGGELRG